MTLNGFDSSQIFRFMVKPLMRNAKQRNVQLSFLQINAELDYVLKT